ncbi:MAG: leucine-rich repeat domain-containing protein, partial [Bacteroidales bacterium]|nr:leucine-rich repeat domain-containing protein [Bacteroidales bacterium]
PALQETDFVALAAEVKSEGGTGMDIYTKAGSPWKVTVTAPTFTDGKYNDNAKVKIGATGIADGEKAILKVTVIASNGQEVSASRPFIFYNGTVVNPAAAGGMEAALNGLDPAEVKDLNIIGTLSADDFKYIKQNLKGSLERINFSNADVTEIPDKAFSDFWKLNEVILPGNLKKLGYQAFVNCPITSITIPDSVTEIDSEAFRAYNSKYAKLESVVIGSGMTEIPRECFFKQTNLKSVSLPQGIITIGQSAFANCNSLTNIELPNTLTEIKNQAFMYCGFTQITIPNNVTKIGVRAFSGCHNLTDVTLSKSLVTIGDSAFNKCGAIATIDLPETIESFDLYIFDWGKATTIICRAKKIPNISKYTYKWDEQFKSVTDKDAAVVKVPSESLNRYKAKWGKYFNNIVAIEE